MDRYALIFDLKQYLELASLIKHVLYKHPRWLTSQMLFIACTWMEEVIEDTKDSNITLFLSFSLFFRFLIQLPSPIFLIKDHSEVQLMAVTCIFICTKLNGTNRYLKSGYYYATQITKAAYTKLEMYQMEQKILTLVNYHIYPPGHFDAMDDEEKMFNIILQNQLIEPH